jgi:hypothetical protein
MSRSRPSIEVVSLSEIQSVWNDSGMARKRATGALAETIVHQTPAGDPRYLGGVSRIVKLFTPNGRHIGTVHEVLMPDGATPHSHPKDYTRRDCSRIRVTAEPPLPQS